MVQIADQHNPNVPNAANVIAEDLVDIKENIEFHKDAFEQICTGWANDSVAALRVFPQNTVAFFGQASAPTSWTKKTDWSDGAMLVVSSDADGTALASGGTIKPQLAHTHGAGSYVIPNHIHNLSKGAGVGSLSPTGSVRVSVAGGFMYTSAGEGSSTLYPLNSATDSGGGSGSITGTSGDTTTAKLPLYQEVIAATKD